MGRVSRYKRVKSCDPFYRGPRRNVSRLFDQRPENEEEQPVPKSLVRLMRSTQNVPKLKRKQNGKGCGSKSAATLMAASKDSGASQETESGPTFQRRKGETLKAYLERIDVESSARIMECFRKNRRMSDRRRRYLEKRRKKRAGKTADEDAYIEFGDLKDEIKFGEVAGAPPRLSAKPRGCHKKIQRGEKQHKLLLQEKLKSSAASDTTVAKRSKQPVGLKRKWDIEEERDKAIQIYRQTKKFKLNSRKNLPR